MTKTRFRTATRLACLVALSTTLAGCFDAGGSSGQSKYSVLKNPGNTAGTIERIAYATVGWEAPSERVDGSPLVNLSGFRIYYGTSPTELTQTVQVPDAATRSARVYNLSRGTWYFAVTAVDGDGMESERSATASKTIS